MARSPGVSSSAGLTCGGCAGVWLDHGNYDAPIFRLNGAIYYQEVAIVDAKAGHRATFHLDEKRCFLVLN